MSAVLKPDDEFAPLSITDLDRVMAIEEVIYPFPWTRGNFVDALRAGYSGWAYRCRGVLVGYAVCMRVLDEVHLLNLSVDAGWQRCGHGARLLRFLIDLFGAAGCRQMLLEVRPSNWAAHRLYQQFGFVRIGVRRNYYPAEGGREDAWVMVREIGDDGCSA
jgi:ribosomal-protein-alanine N-acetyltransferase